MLSAFWARKKQQKFRRYNLLEYPISNRQCPIMKLNNIKQGKNAIHNTQNTLRSTHYE